MAVGTSAGEDTRIVFNEERKKEITRAEEEFEKKQSEESTSHASDKKGEEEVPEAERKAEEEGLGEPQPGMDGTVKQGSLIEKAGVKDLPEGPVSAKNGGKREEKKEEADGSTPKP
ncbi:hypothetical protein SAICODRAFT_70690 [Saitoella complicata NRRL Y-17804]|nr:uncharacterized protein SAICODRAFT_70690 [Saitoella complicata NRRL Y-17804]ODQ54012.1 hypothetical protein SAICODRAFT_70690 [Saitoella complicata NRRL Y-17804]